MSFVNWEGDLFADAADDDSKQYGPVIEAGFTNRNAPCCGDRIEEGQDIRRELSSGDWIHAECAE